VILLASLAPVALAQTPSELLQQADYAARIEQDYAQAAELYRQALEHPDLSEVDSIQARFRLGEMYIELGQDQEAQHVLQSLAEDHPDRTQLVERVNAMLAELIPLDPATLMPPDTIVYVELGSPGRQIETLLEWTRGSPLENPFAVMGLSGQQGQGQNPADMLAALLNPSMLAEFKKVRGLAIGLNSLEGIDQDGAAFVAVLQPGKSDAIRGIIQAALGMAGQPGDPIEGMTLVQNIGGAICAAYDDRAIILSKTPDMLREIIQRYHGQATDASLATGNRLFADLDRRERSQRLATVWVNGPALHAALRRQCEAQGHTPEQLIIAENFFGLADLQQALVTVALEPDQGLALDAALRFAPGHYCLAYDMIRTPNLQRDALNPVPSDAVVLATFALGEESNGLARRFDASLERLTGLDLGREVFANLQQVTFFLLPPDPQLASSALAQHVSPVAPRFGLLLTSNDPQRTFALIEKCLSIQARLEAANGYALAQHGDSRMLAGRFGEDPIYAWLDQQANTTVLTFHPTVLTSALKAGSQRSGITAAGALHNPVAALPDDASKALLVNVGGAIRLAAIHQLKELDPEKPSVRQWAQACESLAVACETTCVELYTRESPNDFALHAELRNLPSLAIIFPLMMQLQQGPEPYTQGKAAPNPAEAIKPAPGNNSPAGPTGPDHLAWQPGRNAQHCLLHLGTAPDNLTLIPGIMFTGKSFSRENPEYPYPAFEPDTTYYWRVDTVNTEGETIPGELWSFTTDGKLIGHWKLDETDGDVADDASSSGFNGQLIGNPTWRSDAGITGGAIELDGIDDAITIPDFEFRGSAVTFTAWINGHKTSDWAGIVYSRGEISGGMHFGGDDNLHYTWNKNSPNTWNWAGPAITPDQWSFVAITIAPDQVQAWVTDPNGNLSQHGKTKWHIAQTLQGLNIGWDPEQDPRGSRRFAGLVDDVRVYNYALTPEEIAAISATKPAP
jgi:tetratricopeptide (TPR) repeat protein